jgi:hypothetical protein
MNNNSDRPKEYDLVLGGNNPLPIDGVVLGGIEGVKSRLASNNIQSQIDALSEAFNYGDVGLDLVIDALNNYRREVRQNAYQLLQQREEVKAKQAVSNYKFWSDFEYLNARPYNHVKTFANRKVEVYDPNIGIIDPVNTAYFIEQATYGDFLRQSSTHRERFEDVEKSQDKFNRLLQDPQICNVEALIFGFWDYLSSNVVVKPLLDASEKLPNLKALFIGDIVDEEMMISSIEQTDISPLLAVYPNLEILHIRGGNGFRDGNGFRFSSEYLECHDRLKAIRIESGGLPREAINGLCALELPALEYLELWMGTPEYGGSSTIKDLMPIISGEAFPNLKYLGLRNAEYTDEIVLELVKSSLIERLVELDLSLGTLGIDGAEALLNCPAINELDTLNISRNWLKSFPETITQFFQLDCEVIADEQDSYDPDIELMYKDPNYINSDDYEHREYFEVYRYCSVRE